MTSETLPEFPHLRDGELSATQGRWDDAIDFLPTGQGSEPPQRQGLAGLVRGVPPIGARRRFLDAPPSKPGDWIRGSRQHGEPFGSRPRAGRGGELAGGWSGPTESPFRSALCVSGESQVQAGPASGGDAHLHPGVGPGSGLGAGVVRNRCRVLPAGVRQRLRAFFEMAVRLDPADEDSVLNWAETCQGSVSGRGGRRSLARFHGSGRGTAVQGLVSLRRG
jgi:hypothetical protein